MLCVSVCSSTTGSKTRGQCGEQLEARPSCGRRLNSSVLSHVRYAPPIIELQVQQDGLSVMAMNWGMLGLRAVHSRVSWSSTSCL